MKELHCKTLAQSLREKYEAGEITLYEAAREFCRYGWTDYVDTMAAKNILENW